MDTFRSEVPKSTTTLRQLKPTLIVAHQNADTHQDHKLISQLTYNTFRDHLILEYEVPNTTGTSVILRSSYTLRCTKCVAKSKQLAGISRARLGEDGSVMRRSSQSLSCAA